MKVLLYECKKIANFRLILALLLFTVLFYDLFIESRYYPNWSSDAAAEVELHDILMKEYGTTFPLSEFNVLLDIKEEAIKRLDELVQSNMVLKEAGITTWKELQEIEYQDDNSEVPENLIDEMDHVYWEVGRNDLFLVQEIEDMYEKLQESPYMGVQEEQAEKRAKENWSYRIGEEKYHQCSSALFERLAKLYTKEEMSMVPTGAFSMLLSDLPKIGILMLICCIIVILPYQIRERINHVNGLFATTKEGRNIWRKRLVATIIVSGMICLIQMIVFWILLWRVGILKYVSCPASGNSLDYLWVDMKFGTYLIWYSLLMILFVMGAVTAFFLISRFAWNYIVGFAAAIPIGVLFSLVCYYNTRGFLYMECTMREVYLPILTVLLMIAMTVGEGIALHKWDKKRDIL